MGSTHEQSGEIRRQAILVLGMHRSGTSSMAGVLSLLGAEPPKTLEIANRWNEKGYWESKEIMNFHDRLLHSADSNWKDWGPFDPNWLGSPRAEAFSDEFAPLLAQEFAEAPLFVMKDPRACRFAPFWLGELKRQGIAAKVVLPFRNPLEVAQSLERRDRMEPTEALLLWLRHCLDAEAATRGLPRSFQRYEALLDDWRGVARKIGDDLGIAWPAWTPESEAKVDAFLTRELRHNVASWDELSLREDVFAWVKGTYECLLALAEGGGDARAKKIRAKLDDIRHAFDEASGVFAALVAREIGGLQERLSRLDTDLAGAKKREESLRADLSARDANVRRLEAEAAETETVIEAERAARAAAEAEAARLIEAYREFDDPAVRSLARVVRRSARLGRRMKELASIEGALPGRRRQRRRKLRLARDVELIAGSGLFDREWYLRTYPDVASSGEDPLIHYLQHGVAEGRNPNPLFDTDWYLRQYPDVAATGQNPLVHFATRGAAERRDPGPPCGRKGPQKKVYNPDLPTDSSGFDLIAPTTRRFPGKQVAQAGHRNVLLCAHTCSGQLFGGERSFLDLIELLEPAPFNVYVAVPYADETYVEALAEHVVEVAHVPYRFWRNDKAPDPRAIASVMALLVEHGIDLVHVNTIMIREPLIAARRLSIPAITHVRESVVEDRWISDNIGLPAADIVDAVRASADCIIGNSAHAAAEFDKDGHTFVVPNTFDMARLDLPNKVGMGEIRIGLISSNLPKKGIEDFAMLATACADEIPNLRFVLIGPDNGHITALRERQRRGEFTDRLEFLGYQSTPEQALAHVNLVANLSHFAESFGRTVAEGLAARRPTLVYDLGAPKDMVQHGETGFIIPQGQWQEAVPLLKALCEQPEHIAAMGEKGRAFIAENYGREHGRKALLSCYERALTVTPPRNGRRLIAPRRAIFPSKGHNTAPLKLAYFCWHFPVPSETFVLNELRLLVAKGYDVEVFCRQSPHPDFQPDFPIHWQRVADPKELASKLRETNRTRVHAHFTYPTVTDMVWPACEEAGIPFTFIAHAQDIFRYANDEKNKIGEIGRSPLCLRVIVPSRYHRDYVESRGVPARKLFINPNGINPDLYSGGWDQDRETRSKRSICAIHRFTEKKGLEHLIRSGKALAEDGIQIHLYGYGELEEQYRELVEQIGLNNVHVHGPVDSRAEMLEVFRQHDLFACPSVRASDGDMDGIPTVLMEAMASGVPVLATGISGIPDLVKDEITGLVCEATPESITQSVRRYYALPDVQVAAMMEDALALIRRDFNVASLSAMLLRVWRQQTVDVLIVSWNSLPQLREVVRRLQKFTQLPFHLVVCDNGSDPDVLAYLCQVHAEYDNTTIIFNRENAYVGPGTNVCMQHGDSDYAVYICGKEGFVLDYGWEKGLVEYMDAHPDVGLAGTLGHSPNYLSGAEYPNSIPLFQKFRNRTFATDNPDRRFRHVQGGFFVIRRAMYDAIGGFSDEVPHSYTDVEYSYYAESAGWKLGTPPRLLALFNKTRPGLFSRIDESVAATHPPRLEDLPLLDRIAHGQIAYCNLCGWHGEAFDMHGGIAICGACGSRPADRSLHRYLAESMLTYRRLPALGINVGVAMMAIWRQQFQGGIHSAVEFRRHLKQHGSLNFSTGALKLVYLDNALDGGDDALVLQEVDRLLAADGIMLMRVGSGDRGQLAAIAAMCRLHDIEPVRFSSRVVRYDTHSLYIGRRTGVAQCVS